MKAVVVDTGVGNIPNAVRGLARAGAEVSLAADAGVVRDAERLVLPGVGAFAAGMARLTAGDLGAAVAEAAGRGVPLLGICLGHQMLFEDSEEFGATGGLGLLVGSVRALPRVERVPHMGWSRIESVRDDPLIEGLEGAWMYFVHSFAAVPGEGTSLATFRWGDTEACAVARSDNVCGVQFHPEKSGAAGHRLLRNFLENVA